MELSKVYDGFTSTDDTLVIKAQVQVVRYVSLKSGNDANICCTCNLLTCECCCTAWFGPQEGGSQGSKP